MREGFLREGLFLIIAVLVGSSLFFDEEPVFDFTD